jgi:hypothetical protein
MKGVLIVLSFVSSALIGQNYLLSSFTSAYSDLVGPQVLTTTEWDDPDFLIIPGFPISINGNSYDSLFLNNLGCTIMGIKNGNELDEIDPVLMDVIDRGYDTGASQSSISTKIEGLTGNRILKIQWKNVGSYEEYDLGGNSMSINFQLWLYEQGGFIEVRYGSSNVTDVSVFYEYESGAGVTISEDNYGTGINNVYLMGNTSYPGITNQYSHMTGTPQSGQVYRLSPKASVSINKNETGKLAAYPNPCYDILYIKNSIDIEEYVIYDVKGRQVQSGSLIYQKTINVAFLSKGVYLISAIKINGDNLRFTFIKE